MEIIAIYDNGGETIDRYTVVFSELATTYDHEMLGLSDNPHEANGFSQWTHGQNGDHLGTKIDFVDLPENVQKHVKSRMDS